MRGAPGFSDGNGDFLSGYVYCRQNNTRKWGAQRAQHQKNAYFGKCGTATTTLTMLARAMRGAPGFSDGNGDFVAGYAYCRQNNTRKWDAQRAQHQKNAYFGKCGTATTTLTILARAMRGTPGSPDRMGISLRVMPTVGRIIHRNGVPSELNNKKTRTSVKCGTATTTLTILARAMRGAPGSPDGMGISLEFRPFSRNFRVISRNSISRGILGRIFFLKPPYFFFFSCAHHPCRF